MNNKRVTLFAGHYGSGKTNIAVNYALHLKEKYENVVITDLDIVNPYFRTADSLEELQNAGIKLISSEFANSNVDTISSSKIRVNNIKVSNNYIFIFFFKVQGVIYCNICFTTTIMPCKKSNSFIIQ